MTKFFFFLICFPLFAGVNRIGPDAVSASANVVGGSATGVTWAHTVGTGINRALVVGIGGAIGHNVTSVKWNGTNLSRVTNFSSTFSEVWCLANPASGTFNIVAVWPAFGNSFNNAQAGAVSLTGVDQTSPCPISAATNTAITQAITTTTPGSWLIGAAVNHNGTLTSTTGQTELANRVASSDAGSLSIGFEGNVPVGSNTMTWSAAGGTGALGVSVAVIQPALTEISSRGGGGIIIQTLPDGPQVRTVSTESFGSGSGGDTNFYAWTQASTRAGNFGGGAILGNWNDGSSGMGCGSSNICLYEILTYDKTTIGNTTFGLVNSMASYGGVGATTCYDQSHTSVSMKTRGIFSLPGLIFQSIGCMKNSNFFWYQSGLTVSPDGGVHWCNYKTYNAHATAPGCDSSNWAANDGTHNGDNPVDAAGFQWPLADGTSKMARLQQVDFLCQDNTVNCPVAHGVDPAYLYFIGQKADLTGFYVYRVLKSLGMGIMNPSNWDAYTGAGFAANTGINASDQSAGVPVQSGSVLSIATGRVTYLKDFGIFYLLGESGTGTQNLTTGYALFPWGPWAGFGLTTLTDVGIGFPSFVPGLCPKYDVAGKAICTVSGNAEPSAHDLYLREMAIGLPALQWAH